MERDHGALLRRADTTTQATAPISASRNGLFVRMAQMARAGRPQPPRHRVQGCGAEGRQPGSFLGRPPSPSEEGEAAQREDDRRHDEDDGEHAAGRAPAARRMRSGVRTGDPVRVPEDPCFPPAAVATAPAVEVVVTPLAAGRRWCRWKRLPGLRRGGDRRALCGRRPRAGVGRSGCRRHRRYLVCLHLRRGRGRRQRRTTGPAGLRSEALQICAYDGATPGWRVAAIVRFVDLEPQALDIVRRIRDRLLGGTVVGVDPGPAMDPCQ